MDSNVYSAWVSTFAAIASAGALYLHWLRWRQDQRTKSLIVKLFVGPLDAEARGWRHAKLTLRSRSNAGYVAKQVKILWPLSARLASRGDLFGQPGANPWDPPTFAHPAETSRRLNVDLAVSHAGQKGAFHPQGHFRTATGDTESAEFFVKSGGNGPLLFAVTIEPEDDAERAFTRRKRVRPTPQSTSQ